MASTRPRAGRFRRWWIVYLALLGVSWGIERWRNPDPPDPATRTVTIDAMRDDGPAPGRLSQIAYREWTPRGGEWAGHAARVPLILLHGSPGDSSNFGRMGPPLASDGRRVIALDLPGFGGSDTVPPSMSILAHARAVLAAMDALGVERAHVLGWSLGGGVAMHMADLAPARVASLTMLGSVTDQFAEGSGSHAFEHLKYDVAWGAATAVRFGTPHLGVLSGFFDVVRSSMRNFGDSDMRPLTGVMARLRTPTLILHGRRDYLTPLWAAQRAHGIIGPSTLLVTPFSHFMPFAQPGESAALLRPFLDRHDDPAAPALRQAVWHAPPFDPPMGARGVRAGDAVRALPWPVLVGLVALATAWHPRVAISVAALLTSFGVLDVGITVLGALAGQAGAALWALAGGWRRAGRGLPAVLGTGVHARSPRLWAALLAGKPGRFAMVERFVPGAHAAAWRAVGALARARAAPWPDLGWFLLFGALSWVVFALYFFLATIIVGAGTAQRLAEHGGAVGTVVGSVLVIGIVRLWPLLLTRPGRLHLLSAAERLTHREYWPTWAVYWTIAPYFIYKGLSTSPAAFSAANPAIGGGGGMTGESKREVLEALARGAPEAVLPFEFVPAGPAPAERAGRALRAIAERPELGGLPIILKPDNGFRGHALRLARTEDDVRAYFEHMDADAILQRYHPGPVEVGVLWARRPESPDGPGFVYAITAKVFPELVGDGVRTLEQLIWLHPRTRRQAGVFLERFADRRDEVVPAGRRLRLAASGNHCQGTMFLDGSHLLTPQLEAAIDHIAQSFHDGRGPGGLDIGRFDVRAASEGDLRAGRRLAIVELNGTSGEPTNMYDPGRSWWWAVRVLVGQWRLLYELGHWRRRQGFNGPGLLTLWWRSRVNGRRLRGSSVAD